MPIFLIKFSRNFFPSNIMYIFLIKFSRNFFPSNIMYIFFVSDLLACLLYTPTWCSMWIVAMHQSQINCLLWKVHSTGGHILTAISLLAITCITVDINVSILHLVSNKRTFLVITCL